MEDPPQKKPPKPPTTDPPGYLAMKAVDGKYYWWCGVCSVWYTMDEGIELWHLECSAK